MIVLAAIPSVSVLAVTARAAAFGFSHGMFAALGIVAGDIIFILIAVYGLAFIAEMMGEQFAIIKLLGGAYLIWLGISLWRADARMRSSDSPAESSWSSSFMTGLLITLGDQKAILFYLGFFPAFIDLSNMTPADTLIIIVIAALGVGGAKLGPAAQPDLFATDPVEDKSAVDSTVDEIRDKFGTYSLSRGSTLKRD